MERIQVQMPDGSVIDAPAGTTKEQIAAKYQKMGGKLPEAPGMFDGFINEAKNLGTGFAKGLGGLATMAGDAFADDPQTRMAVAAAGGKQPKVGDVSRMVAGMGYQPKTPGERLRQSTAAGVGGAIFPGPGVVSAPIKQMAIGGFAGAGSEIGSQLTGGNPLGGLAGGLIGGGLAGVGANLKGNSQALAREALEGVDPRDLERARINQFRAQKAGVPINLSQAMEKPSNIDTIVEALANSRNGKKVTQQLRDQPKQVGVEIENQMLKLPGEVRAPQTVANNAQDVATKVIESAKKGRTEAWRKAFDSELETLRSNAEGTLQSAVKKAAEKATKLARVRKSESGLKAQLEAANKGEYDLRMQEHSQAVKQTDARNLMAQQLYEEKLAAFNAPQNLPSVGADAAGRLRSQAEIGQAALNQMDMKAGTQAVRGGTGQILLPDGTAASERFKPQPPGPPQMEVPPAPPTLSQTQFPERAPMLAQELAQREAAAKSAKTALENVQDLPQTEVSKAYQKLTKAAESRPNTGLAAAILDLRNRLTNGENGFITNVDQLNGVLKDATTKLKNPNLSTTGVDAGEAKYLGSLVNELREGWGEKFSPIREANAIFKQQTDDVINPLKKGVVGDIAGRRGAVPDAQAVKTKLTTLFDAGTVPGAKSSDILKLEKAFRGVPQGPEGISGSAAYQDAVKSWMAGKVSSASQLEGGRIDPNVAGNLEKIFRGNDTKAQGFRDMLVGLARSEGKPDAAYVKGMENFLKVTSMAARRPARVQGLSTGGAAEIAGQTLATQNGQTSWSPMRNLLIRWSERVNADAYKEMDRLLTSPEGVGMLQKLAKTPPTSPAAQTAVATFLGTNAAMLDEAGAMPQPEE